VSDKFDGTTNDRAEKTLAALVERPQTASLKDRFELQIQPVNATKKRTMTNLIRFRVRPVFHGSDLLVEVLDDHRAADFPNVATILQDTLHSVQVPHPDGLDEPVVALSQDRYFSYWTYARGSYEIDDDIWGLFVTASIVADIETALLSTGKFVKEEVDFSEFQ